MAKEVNYRKKYEKLLELISSKDNNDEYKIKELRLKISLEENSKQMDGFKSIDTKASFLIIIISSLFAIFLGMMIEIKITSYIKLASWHIIIVSIVFFIMTFLFIILTIVSRKIETIDLNELNSKLQDDSYIFYLDTLFLTYKDTVNRNYKRLDKKHKYYKLSIWFLLLTIILMFMNLIIIFSNEIF